MKNIDGVAPCVNYSLFNIDQEEMRGRTFVYEVNLSINMDMYKKHGAWFLEHIQDMVDVNKFDAVEILNEVNMDPINDNHLREHKLSVRYYVSSGKQLLNYLKENAKNMRSQVVDKFGNQYEIFRRVFVVDNDFLI